MRNVLYLFAIFLIAISLVACKNNSKSSMVASTKTEESSSEESINKEQLEMLEIEEMIRDYLKYQAMNQINENDIQYEFTSALKILNEITFDNFSLDTYFNIDTLQAYYQTASITSLTDYFKMLINYRNYGVACPSASNYFSNLTMDDMNPWTYTYTVIALKILNVNSSLLEELVPQLNVILDGDYRDADYAGIALMALSDLEAETDNIYPLIINNITDEGVSSFGNANACSTALSILGLLAQNNHLNSEEYLRNGKNLAMILMQYYDFNLHGFKYSKTDDEISNFANNQSFAALVCYYAFLKTGEKQVLFK